MKYIFEAIIYKTSPPRSLVVSVAPDMPIRSAGYALSLAPDMPILSAGYARPPLGVPADLQSAVKKCPNLFMLWGFAIPSHQNSKRITDCRNLKHDSFHIMKGRLLIDF